MQDISAKYIKNPTNATKTISEEMSQFALTLSFPLVWLLPPDWSFL
jgi:hypothetical protein